MPHTIRPALCMLPLLPSLLAGCASQPVTPLPERSAALVRTIADDYVREYFAHFPEEATAEGRAAADHGRLSDNSLAGPARWQAREDAWLASLGKVDARQLAGTDDHLTYGFLREVLESAAAARVCRGELWSVSPTYTGWQSRLANLAPLQPVGNEELREKALSRVRAIPRMLDNEIANLREGLRRGYSAPSNNVERTIEQMDRLLATSPRESPFFNPGTRDDTPRFVADLEKVIAEELNPAIRLYRDFLAEQYRPSARNVVGVSANPNGVACYEASVRFHTSLAIPPSEIHETGLREMKKIAEQMKEIGERSFGTGEVTTLLRNVKGDPRYAFQSKEEMVTVATAAVGRARSALPRFFGTVPRADVIIRPYPPFQEKNAPPGQYQSASDDGARPGTYLINTYDAQKQSRAGGLESIAFHETYPGHHLQISIAKERTKSHPITRYFSSSGFTEGWGLYSERLADEMGLFSSDVDRLGLLSSEAHRAVRLVVDSGMHALGWSRRQAVDYMLANTALPAAMAEAEIDRYIAVPGQATSYMVGSLEIRRLRQLAEKRQGASFDLRVFHDRILEDGGVTLSMLREKIERWLDTGSQPHH